MLTRTLTWQAISAMRSTTVHETIRDCVMMRWQVRRGLPLQDLSGKRGFPDEGPPKGSGGPLDSSVQVPASQAKPASKPQPEPEVGIVTQDLITLSGPRCRGVAEDKQLGCLQVMSFSKRLCGSLCPGGSLPSQACLRAQTRA